MGNAKINFVQQQGYTSLTPPQCAVRYPALIFQPRVLFVVFSISVIFSLHRAFFLVSLLLFFSALLPSLNPFDALYRFLFPRHSKFNARALAPRRFSQLLGGAFCLVIFFAAQFGMPVLYWSMASSLLFFNALPAFTNFCMPALLYHIFSGKLEFALKTLPWRS